MTARALQGTLECEYQSCRRRQAQKHVFTAAKPKNSHVQSSNGTHRESALLFHASRPLHNSGTSKEMPARQAEQHRAQRPGFKLIGSSDVLIFTFPARADSFRLRRQQIASCIYSPRAPSWSSTTNTSLLAP